MAEPDEDLPKVHSRDYSGRNKAPINTDRTLILGWDNVVADSAIGVLVTGSNNVVGEDAQNISIMNSSGNTVVGGLHNVTILNSSGVTVTESNTYVVNGVVQFSPSTGNSSHKKYVALLTQSGTSAPVATILENTLGVITWTYDSAGTYLATSAALFTANKTAILLGSVNNTIDATTFLWTQNSNTSEIYVTTYVSSALSNNVLSKTLIEIRVYT